jgi:hypothetical protein
MAMPFGPKTWVMPTLRPSNPLNIALNLLGAPFTRRLALVPLAAAWLPLVVERLAPARHRTREALALRKRSLTDTRLTPLVAQVIPEAPRSSLSEPLASRADAHSVGLAWPLRAQHLIHRAADGRGARNPFLA